MTRHTKSLLVALVAVVSAIALAACGSSNDDKSSSQGGGAEIKPVSGQKKGGTLQVQSVEGFEHLDPGSSYFQLDYEVVYAVQRPLYSFKPEDPTRVVPDLAASDPQISADENGKTIGAGDIEEGVLLPCETGEGQVLCRGRGPDRHRHASAHSLVGFPDRGIHLGWDRRFLDQPPGPRGNRAEFGRDRACLARCRGRPGPDRVEFGGEGGESGRCRQIVSDGCQAEQIGRAHV